MVIKGSHKTFHTYFQQFSFTITKVQQSTLRLGVFIESLNVRGWKLISLHYSTLTYRNFLSYRFFPYSFDCYQTDIRYKAKFGKIFLKG